eukprot:scaffold748_cov251-Pinguiococcus_pyrenoidosus.AAC.15
MAAAAAAAAAENKVSISLLVRFQSLALATAQQYLVRHARPRLCGLGEEVGVLQRNARLRCQDLRDALVRLGEGAGALVDHLQDADDLAGHILDGHAQDGLRLVAALLIVGLVEARVGVGIWDVDHRPVLTHRPRNAFPEGHADVPCLFIGHLHHQIAGDLVDAEDGRPIGLHDKTCLLHDLGLGRKGVRDANP